MAHNNDPVRFSYNELPHESEVSVQYQETSAVYNTEGRMEALCLIFA